MIIIDISERNNDYSDTHDFGRVVIFFISEVPNYKILFIYV